MSVAKEREYIDFCENVGWNYVDCTGNIYYFCTESEDIVQIETDENLKFQTVKKAIFRGKIIPSIIGVIIALFSLIINFTLNLNPMLLSPIMFETIFIWILVLGLHLYNLIRYYLWVKKAKNVLSAGGKMPEEKKFSYWVYVVMVVVFAVVHSAISVVLSVKYGDIVGYIVPVIWIIMFVILFFSRWMTMFAEKNKIGRNGHLILQLVALPAICVMLILVVTIVIIATDKEKRSDTIIKKEDVSIFYPGTDISDYSVDCSSFGDFILAMDRIFITSNKDDLDIYNCNMVIYRSKNKYVINSLLREVNKFRVYSIYFDMDGATKYEENEIVIYEAQTNENNYEYLIYDEDTILCLYTFNEKLNQEQLAYFREVILNN